MHIEHVYAHPCMCISIYVSCVIICIYPHVFVYTCTHVHVDVGEQGKEIFSDQELFMGCDHRTNANKSHVCSSRSFMLY